MNMGSCALTATMVAACFAVCALPTRAQDGKPHFSYIGPLDTLVAKDVKIVAERPRITVLTKEGAFVTAFGRGGKTDPMDPNVVLPGGLKDPVDLVLAPDGRVLTLTKGQGDDGLWIQVFQPL